MSVSRLSSVKSPMSRPRRPGRDIGAKAPCTSCVISRTRPGPALGAQFLCSNLSSLLRASLSLLFFVQSQLGYHRGYRGHQCIDHVRKLLWHRLRSTVPQEIMTMSQRLRDSHPINLSPLPGLRGEWRTDFFLATKLTSWMDNLWVSLIPTKGIWGGEIF